MVNGLLISLLSHNLARWLVVANSEKSRVAEFAVLGPFNETYLDDELGTDPVSA